MTIVTFDTLKFVEKLKAAGVPEGQAKATSEAFQEAQGELDKEYSGISVEQYQADWKVQRIVERTLQSILKQ